MRGKGSWDQSEFPNLKYGKDKNHKVTSCRTARYNCIAWAADDPLNFWWPDGSDHWPTSAPYEVTLPAFIRAFETLGYETCDNGDLEAGYEKIVIYVDTNNEPTHAARQLRNGRWTSKLGRNEDIRHNTPTDVAGPCYGLPCRFLKRRRRRLTISYIRLRIRRLVRILRWEIANRVMRS
jgi:hypothetical protein